MTKTKTKTKQTDRQLIIELRRINRELFKRHGTDPNEDQEITGLETLSSAIDELEDETLYE